ncbi:tetratricopeptide repeat protein [uncultured Methanospirillum sp.]|uniref:tetratricopeptide repeat protein n=1 Tax=uncultured Methanospirillum sp. TaxID=262503 RepID=UPI0029C8E31B|nr:tetratricopeptide repeat protein [uncultured Methanospirillum sp.]
MSVMITGQEFSAPDRTVIITNPYTEITMHQALEMQMAGNYEKALEMYDQVLQMEPAHAGAHHAKGNTYDLMGRYNEAISCYDSALECDPFNSETWYNKGVTLRKMGCDDESAECMIQGVSRSI